ncbi:lipid droplet-associated protein [Tsukamurella serpentis]
MSRLPFVVRVAVGAVAVAAEKGQEIVSGAVSAPLTLGSKSAQAFIAVQQDLAELAVRGDRALETVFPAKDDEQAAWATFDDDEDVDVDLPEARPGFGEVRPATGPAESAESAESAPAPSGTGRYALYSSPVPAPSSNSHAPAADLPAVAQRIDYPELTLAQLRGRLSGLTTAEVESLVEYERGNGARPPFLTMLENRITR